MEADELLWKRNTPVWAGRYWSSVLSSGNVGRFNMGLKFWDGWFLSHEVVKSIADGMIGGTGSAGSWSKGRSEKPQSWFCKMWFPLSDFKEAIKQLGVDSVRCSSPGKFCGLNSASLGFSKWIREAFFLIFLLEILILFSEPFGWHFLDKICHVFFALPKNNILGQNGRFPVKKLTQKCLIIGLGGISQQIRTDSPDLRKRPA